MDFLFIRPNIKFNLGKNINVNSWKTYLSDINKFQIDESSMIYEK